MAVSLTSVSTGGSTVLNGTSRYLNTTGPITLGTALFTIELFANFSALPVNGSFMSLTCQGSDFRFFIQGVPSGNSIFNGWQGVTPLWSGTSPIAIATGTWYHLCIMRSSSTVVNMYVNGIVIPKTTDTTTLVTYTSTGMTVGFDNSSNSYYANATITNQRYVNGAAAYPIGGFNPPKSPLLNISGTQLLLLSTNASVYLNDSSTANTGGTPYTMTAAGSPTFSSSTPFALNSLSVGPGWSIG